MLKINFFALITCMILVTNVFAESRCQKAASVLATGVVNSAKVSGEIVKFVNKPKFKGLNLANGASAQYTFSLQVGVCPVDYLVEFESEYCVVESLKVENFCSL